MDQNRFENLVRMMEVGLQRLREADTDMAIAKVLRTMSAVCDNQARTIERDLNKKFDDAMAYAATIEALKENA